MPPPLLPRGLTFLPPRPWPRPHLPPLLQAPTLLEECEEHLVTQLAPKFSASNNIKWLGTAEKIGSQRLQQVGGGFGGGAPGRAGGAGQGAGRGSTVLSTAGPS